MLRSYTTRLSFTVFGLLFLLGADTQDIFAQRKSAIDKAETWKELGSTGVVVKRLGNTIWLDLQSSAIKSKKVTIPRFCAPFKSISWKDGYSSDIKFWPEIEEWVFSWKKAPKNDPVIKVVFDREPVLPGDCPMAIPAGDNSITLHAYQATTVGEKLRFEPQWFKNTVGYWAVGSDYATWKLRIDEPGTYSVAVLQGCGKGQGGSEAAISLRQGKEIKAELPFKTIDTGHFQNFRWNHLGNVKITSEGEFELRIEARKIAKVALFDVRTIQLVKQAQPTK